MISPVLIPPDEAAGCTCAVVSPAAALGAALTPCVGLADSAAVAAETGSTSKYDQVPPLEYQGAGVLWLLNPTGETIIAVCL